MFNRSTIIIGCLAGLLSACAGHKDHHDAVQETSSSSSTTRQTCGQDDARADFQGLERGSLVRLNAQTEDDVPVNWSPDMDFYLGQVTRVVDLLGVDAQGCPGVRVEADAGVFFWRVRDLERVQAQSDDTRCGQNELTADYLGLQPETRVRIEKATPWQNTTNRVKEMDAFVGQEAAVVAASGVDEAGCPGVLLDLDHGVFFWRVRDLKRL